MRASFGNDGCRVTTRRHSLWPPGLRMFRQFGKFESAGELKKGFACTLPVIWTEQLPRLGSEVELFTYLCPLLVLASSCISDHDIWSSVHDRVELLRNAWLTSVYMVLWMCVPTWWILRNICYHHVFLLTNSKSCILLYNAFYVHIYIYINIILYMYMYLGNWFLTLNNKNIGPRESGLGPGLQICQLHG